jgi:hypothetical protein
MVKHVNRSAAEKPAPQPKPEEKACEQTLRIEALEERVAPIRFVG